MANKKRVLLVDDDVDFLAINKGALEAAGFAVECAIDGNAGLQLAKEQALDAAVLDIIMRTPDEGLELARKLRREPRTQKLPIVMLTSINTVYESRGHLFRLSDQDRDDLWLPVDRFIDKPVKPEALVAVVRELTA